MFVFTCKRCGLIYYLYMDTIHEFIIGEQLDHYVISNEHKKILYKVYVKCSLVSNKPQKLFLGFEQE